MTVPPSPAALSVDRLSYHFGGRTVLDALDLTVAPGSFTVLLGPNGAGKTTLVSLVAGLYAARHGEVRIFGRSVRRDPLRALARIGVVFQTPSLDLDLTASENLAYHGALHGLSREVALGRARAELDRLGILDRASNKVRVLSSGLRRRVEIARALLHEPSLLLIDEGTVGLDVASRQALLAYVRALCEERGTAVLWATHLLDEVQAGDALLVLARGRLRWSGSASDLSSPEALHETFLRMTNEQA